MDSNVTLPLNLDASFRISALNKRSALFLETSHSFCKSENRLILENSLKKAEFARKFDLYLKNFTIMIHQEPSDIKARIPRIIIVTISDWAIICKTGTVLFKTTSKILFFFTEYGYKIQKQKNKKSSISTFFNKCKKSTSLSKYFCILKSHKQNG